MGYLFIRTTEHPCFATNGYRSPEVHLAMADTPQHLRRHIGRWELDCTKHDIFGLGAGHKIFQHQRWNEDRQRQYQ